MDDKKRIYELVSLLKEASKAYYQEAAEIMSNFEYDQLYDELLALEKKTGIVLVDSPTQNVGYEVVSALPKETHPSRMLSLDKTKSVETLQSWIGDQVGILSWKMDGLTIVLTYENGILQKAVTRGNGEVGEVVTANVKTFRNVPLHIPFQGRLVLRGEAVMKYEDFDKINAKIADVEAQYKNPRNLCSGSVRQLNSKVTAERNVYFIAFSLVSCEADADEVLPDFQNQRKEQFRWLEEQGFDVVERKVVKQDTMQEAVEAFRDTIGDNAFPSDGLVLLLDDIQYGQSLGTTAKFPRDAIAFKWQDETVETVLKEIEWSASRTGLINPVAVFEPVELEGTTVSRASLHNVSIVEGLKLGIGDVITVYKANMIIPQVGKNKTQSGNITIPALCPVCHAETKIEEENAVKVLRCENPKCLAKQIKSFTHFMSRDAMNVEGLSEATVEKMIAHGYITELADLFHIGKYGAEIIEMEGFGEKSLKNMLASIEKARKTTPAKFLYSLGIDNVGLANAKLICKAFDEDIDAVLSAEVSELVEIDHIGQVIAESVVAYLQDAEHQKNIQDLRKELEIIPPENHVGNVKLEGIQFVVTGAVTQFANRKELQAYIEERGGKVTSSVTSKTNYLINNDNTSTSSKNKKAQELGIPILTEQEFLAKFG